MTNIPEFESWIKYEQEYTAEPVVAEVFLEGIQTVENANLEEGMFTFALIDQNLNLIGKTSNDSEGRFQFSLKFNETGFYTFYIKETSTQKKGWTKDFRMYTACVTVADDEGKLSALVEYPQGNPKFHNTQTLFKAEL